jgi:1-acyl-sn-glycerol-3-phosphate acyltransferase
MLRNLVCIVVAVLWLAILFPIACLAMLFTLNAGASIWVARNWWAPVLLRVAGARLVVEGQQHVDPRRPTIYASNHQSTIDIPVLFIALPVNIRFIAKEQLRWVPFVGWYLWLAGHVLVDRGNTRRAVASLDKAGQRIRRGTSIIVFPEGTRSPDSRVRPFKKGSFALALKARVPICPVTIEGSGRLMPKNSWNIKPGTIQVRIGSPIDVSRYGEDDREELMRAVRNVIIAQSLELGGKGGDWEDVVAARGLEGIGRKPRASVGGQ